MRSSLFFGCHAAESLLRCNDRHPTSIHYLPYYKMHAGVDECKGRGETGGMARKYVASARKNATNATYFAWIATDLARPSSNQGNFPLTKLKSGHSGTDGDVGGQTGGEQGLWRMEQGKNLHKKPAALRPLTRGDGAQGRRLAIQNYGTYHSPPSSSVCFLSLLRSSSSSSSGVYSSS